MQGPVMSSQEDATPVSSSLLKRVYSSAVGGTGAMSAEPNRRRDKLPGSQDGNKGSCGTSPTYQLSPWKPNQRSGPEDSRRCRCRNGTGDLVLDLLHPRGGNGRSLPSVPFQARKDRKGYRTFERGLPRADSGKCSHDKCGSNASILRQVMQPPGQKDTFNKRLLTFR